MAFLWDCLFVLGGDKLAQTTYGGSTAITGGGDPRCQSEQYLRYGRAPESNHRSSESQLDSLWFEPTIMMGK